VTATAGKTTVDDVHTKNVIRYIYLSPTVTVVTIMKLVTNDYDNQLLDKINTIIFASTY